MRSTSDSSSGSVSTSRKKWVTTRSYSAAPKSSANKFCPTKPNGGSAGIRSRTAGGDLDHARASFDDVHLCLRECLHKVFEEAAITLTDEYRLPGMRGEQVQQGSPAVFEGAPEGNAFKVTVTSSYRIEVHRANTAQKKAGVNSAVSASTRNAAAETRCCRRVSPNSPKAAVTPATERSSRSLRGCRTSIAET